MKITRHFIDVGNRRVHYRRAGSGPPLLMVHQSPRSSTEYEALMMEWGADFTCIAPDTPGFGQSTPLADSAASIDAFADAIVELLDSLKLDRVAAYGFHSGGIILVNAVKRHPQRFSCLAVGGYAIWTPAEMALFGDRYLPPFLPSAYGEHLVWLWNRVLEQTWFFPWFAVEPAFRLSVAHADVARVDAVVQELLDAGDAYRVGYGAVLRAPRDIPAVDAVTPPVRITAYDGDPLQEHIDRLGAMPTNWSAAKVKTAAEHIADSLEFLRRYPAPGAPELHECRDEGFTPCTVAGFSGVIHWRGTAGGALVLHRPGESVDLVDAAGGIAIDLPGHGLSSAWPAGWSPSDPGFPAFVETIAAHFGCTHIVWPTLLRGEPELLFPDLIPDRFGAYLTQAWAIVRSRKLFDPWYDASAATAQPFDPAMLAPARLALEHRALIRATGARNYHLALQQQEKTHGNS